MLNHLKPTLKLLRNRIFRCAAACPLGAHCGSAKSSLRALAARKMRQRIEAGAASYGKTGHSCKSQRT